MLYSAASRSIRLTAVAAYNRANASGPRAGSARPRMTMRSAIKLDPSFVEAWFNFAGLLRERGRDRCRAPASQRAIAIDPDYADAVYNLATLEFDAGSLAEARRWWTRYLELDSETEWARTAARGIAVHRSSTRARSAG